MEPKNFLIILFLLAFLAVSVFGLFLSVTNGQHLDIPACMSGSKCENMVEHLSHWQHAFTVSLSSLVVLLVIVALSNLLIRNVLAHFYLNPIYSLSYKQHGSLLAFFRRGLQQPTL